MFINDEKLTIHDDIILIALKKLLSADGIVEITDQGRIGSLIEIFNA